MIVANMTKSPHSEKLPAAKGLKIISLLLMLGGCFGVALTVAFDFGLLTTSGMSIFSPTVAIAGVFIVIFGWCVWTGIDLWRGRRQALPWAKILFAIQIPTLIVPGFSYEFHTGFVVRIMASVPFRLGANFNFGSSFSFYISPSIHGFAIGVNIVAVIVLVYLMRAARPARIEPDHFGLI